MNETIPEGWEEVKVGDISSYQKGRKPSVEIEEYADGFQPYLTTDYLRNGSCSRFAKDEKKNVNVNEGEILLLWDGSNAGEIFRAKSGVLASTMVKFSLKDKYSKNFMYYQFKTIEKKLRRLTQGTGIPHVDKTYLNTREILCPKKILEQEKIADILSKTDDQIQLIEEIIAKTERLKKGLMISLLSESKFSNFKIISEITKTGAGGTPSRSNKEYYKGNIPWLKSGELNDNKFIIDSSEHISEEAIKKSSAKIFPKNTILMAMYGATVGKMGIIKTEASTNQAVCGIYSDESFDLDFLYYALYMKKEDLIKQGKGGAQPNISQEIIRRTKIPFPNKLEQIKIGKSISSVDKQLNKLFEEKQELQQIKKGLMQDLLSGKVRLRV